MTLMRLAIVFGIVLLAGGAASAQVVRVRIQTIDGTITTLPAFPAGLNQNINVSLPALANRVNIYVEPGEQSATTDIGRVGLSGVLSSSSVAIILGTGPLVQTDTQSSVRVGQDWRGLDTRRASPALRVSIPSLVSMVGLHGI